MSSRQKLQETIWSAYSFVHPYLPSKISSARYPAHENWSAKDLKKWPIPDPNAKVRLLFAPANYAQQGFLWAEAISEHPDVSAVNLDYKNSSRISFKSHLSISRTMGTSSPQWSKNFSSAVPRLFTHFVIEAGLPTLGRKFRNDLKAEIAFLQARGVKVALLFHGSDIRLPSKHRELFADSPFFGELDGLTEKLQISASRNLDLAAKSGVPIFVSTPDLLDYVPQATWLPTRYEAEFGAGEMSQRFSPKLKVAHIPSRGALKGTKHVQRELSRLANKGVIDYRELSGLSRAQLRNEIADADLVIDQLTMGLYGVASLEAIAAGKLVVAEVSEQTREKIRNLHGVEVPIIEADAQNIAAIVAAIAQDPNSFVPDRDVVSKFLKLHGASGTTTALGGFLGIDA